MIEWEGRGVLEMALCACATTFEQLQLTCIYYCCRSYGLETRRIGREASPSSIILEDPRKGAPEFISTSACHGNFDVIIRAMLAAMADQTDHSNSSPRRRYLLEPQRYEAVALGLPSNAAVISRQARDAQSQVAAVDTPVSRGPMSDNDTWSLAPEADLTKPIERYLNTEESHERFAVNAADAELVAPERVASPASEDSISLSVQSPKRSAAFVVDSIGALEADENVDLDDEFVREIEDNISRCRK